METLLYIVQAILFLSADGGSIKLKDAGTTFGTFSKTGNDFHITANRQLDGDMRFFGNDDRNFSKST